MTDFGNDTATTFGPGGLDLDPSFRRITGQEAVAHAVARRLTSPRGSIAWAPDVGIDVRDSLNDSLDGPTLRALSSEIRREAEGEERVSSADVTATFDASTSVLTISLDLDTADGPFTLVLTVSALALQLQVTPTAAATTTITSSSVGSSGGSSGGGGGGGGGKS